MKSLRLLRSSIKSTKSTQNSFSLFHTKQHHKPITCCYKLANSNNIKSFSTNLHLKEEENKETKPTEQKEEVVDTNFPSTQDDLDFIKIMEAKQRGDLKFTDEMFSTLISYLVSLPKEKRQKIIYWLARDKNEMKLVRKIKEAFIHYNLVLANPTVQFQRALVKEKIWAKFTNFQMVPATVSHTKEVEFQKYKVKFLYDLSKYKSQADVDDMDEIDELGNKEDEENERRSEVEDQRVNEEDSFVDEEDNIIETSEEKDTTEQSLEKDVREEEGEEVEETEDAENVEETKQSNIDPELAENIEMQNDWDNYQREVERLNDLDPERTVIPKMLKDVANNLDELGQFKQKRFRTVDNNQKELDDESIIKTFNDELMRKARLESTAKYFGYQFDEGKLISSMKNFSKFVDGASLNEFGSDELLLKPSFDVKTGIENRFFNELDLDKKLGEYNDDYDGNPKVDSHPLTEDVEDPIFYHGQKDALVNVSFEETVLKLSRNCSMTTGGRVESFNCLFLVGSYAGFCGVGFGTAASPQVAQAKAKKAAYKNVRSIHPDAVRPRSQLIRAKHGSSIVRIYPSSYKNPTASPLIRKICAYLGLEYCSVRVYGSRNVQNVIPALFSCIDQLKSLEQEAEIRGVMPIYAKSEFENYLDKVRANKGLFGH
ncbi:hypothetical protein ABK040_010586 [Willaertia magna]